MDIMYNVPEFRKNLRKAFNDADNGHQVLVERYGQVYQLSSLVGEPDANGVYHHAKHDTHEDDGTPIEAAPQHAPVPEVKTKDNPSPFQCKTCGAIKVAGACMTKDCKG